MGNASHTDLADINEILLGYYLNGGSWYDKEAKKQHDTKAAKASKVEYDQQDGRAKVMALETIKWSQSNGYKPPIKKVWWTARPGVLSGAVGREVDSRKNPTDILMLFARGPADGFLGISAKSTKTKGDIAFKNPGLGTIENALHINLHQYPEAAVDHAVKKFKLSPVTQIRKGEIRANPTVQKATIEMGTRVLNQLRDAFLARLNKMNNDELLHYLMDYWMDSSGEIYPPYIKVTGMGNKPPYTAKVSDPLKNDKLHFLVSQTIKIDRVGNDSVGVIAGGHKIMKMRFKYESEKLASSVKASGDPY